MGRVRSTTYLYDDPDHPDRPTGTVESPEWTDDDRALLLALAEFETTLCPGPCGEPIAVAWHTDMDGYFDGRAFHCYACTALRGEDTVYQSVANTRPAEKPLALFELGTTTYSPEPTP